MKMHKGDAGTLFKVMAILLVIGLVLTLVSGVLMAWQNKNLRKLVLIYGTSGGMVLLILVLISLN